MWITVCIDLHNILLDLNDTWDQKEGWWSEEEQEEHDEDLFQLSQQDQGRYLYAQDCKVNGLGLVMK